MTGTIRRPASPPCESCPYRLDAPARHGGPNLLQPTPAALGERIAATVEQHKAQDPKALQARIRELEKQLAARPVKETVRVQVQTERVEVPVLTEEHRAAVVAAYEAFTAAAEQAVAALDPVRDGLARIAEPSAARPPTRPTPTPRPEPARPQPRTTTTESPTRPGGSLSKAVQAAMIAGYRHTSGGYRNTLSQLRTGGLIVGGKDDLAITELGMSELGDYEPLPFGRALIDWWKTNQLAKAEAAILDALVEAYPGSLGNEAIAERTGYSATSGGFRNSLSRLRTLQLITGYGEMTVNPTLMGDVDA